MLNDEEILKNKETYLALLTNLSSVSDNTKQAIVNFLNSSDFFTAPASSNFHANFKGGLCFHSLNVVKELKNLTAKLNLTWQNEDSPTIIGLFHDFCKINLYEAYERNVKVGDVWQKRVAYKTSDTNPLLGLHGDRSVTMLLMLRKSTKDFTLEELAGIRYHMGPFMDQDRQKFQEAIKNNINIYWTHIADNLASLSEEVIN